MLDLTQDGPRPAHRPPRPPAATGGYTAVARLLNEAFDWEASGRRPVRRQQVQAWHKYGVLNQLGQLPPSPVQTDPDPVHTYPTWIFDTTAESEWITWAAAGVPGPNGGQGWVVPARRP
jgi:hypothetical protein